MTAEQKYISDSRNELHRRQNILVHAFLVNSALVALVAVCMAAFDVGDAMAEFLGGPRVGASPYMTNGLVAWGVGGVVIFLIPALATYWARMGLDADK
ncbi:MAG: hypothetical protein K2L95_00385 [Alphaproteobacteria bacterium]|nr:hypothetical protein [Alphaproteobacteria bacterium]